MTINELIATKKIALEQTCNEIFADVQTLTTGTTTPECPQPDIAELNMKLDELLQPIAQLAVNIKGLFRTPETESGSGNAGQDFIYIPEPKNGGFTLADEK